MKFPDHIETLINWYLKYSDLKKREDVILFLINEGISKVMMENPPTPLPDEVYESLRKMGNDSLEKHLKND